MSVSHERIRLVVADKTGAWLGTIGSYLECRVVPRWNAGGTLEVSMDADHPRVPDLVTPGARLLAHYRVSADAPWRLLVSGAVTDISREGARDRTVLTFSVTSDFTRVLGGLLGWVNPAGGTADGWIEGQGDDEAYWRTSGSAERVAMQLIAANAHRSSVPVAVAVPNPGRGPQTSVDVRNKTLHEALEAVLKLGVGIRVVPAASGPGLVVSGYVGRNIPQPMTEASGVVNDGSFSITGPTATRVQVAGPGEGVERLFRLVVNEALEAEWGYSIETFRDARDLKSDAPDGSPPTRSPALAAAMDARGMESLAEGAPLASASASLTESEAFRFGVGYELGDTVTIVLDGAPPVTERITEVEITNKAGDGLVVVPHVGERRDDPSTAAIRLAVAAMRGVRDLRAGR